MSTAGGVWARGRLYLAQRFPRLRRLLPPVLAGLTGAVALASGFGSGLRAACLPLWLLALSWPVWLAPEEGLPQLTRWRRVQRRVCGRVTVVMLGAASVALAPAWHAWAPVAVWLAALSPAPLLLDPLLWRVWTHPIQDAVRSARALTLLQEPRRFQALPPSHRPQPGFDPDEGYCGRPVPLHRVPAPPERGPRLANHRRTPEGALITVEWDGRGTLTLGVENWQTIRLPIEEIGELVTVRESGPRELLDVLLVLDREGRCLATMERAGVLSVTRVGDIASAAGLPFAAYELGTGDGLAGLLFPPARTHQRLWGA